MVRGSELSVGSCGPVLGLTGEDALFVRAAASLGGNISSDTIALSLTPTAQTALQAVFDNMRESGLHADVSRCSAAFETLTCGLAVAPECAADCSAREPCASSLCAWMWQQCPISLVLEVLWRALARRPGGLRCVVNSGVYKGASDLARVLDLAPHDYRAMVQCNVLTPLAVFRAALRAMLRQGGAGSLVQVSSSSVGMTPRASVDKGGWDFGYVSTKAAIAKLMPLLALEHPPAPGAPDALRFFNVEPGLVVTELMKHKGLSGSYTAGFGDVPPQVAGAVVAHLCSQPFAAVSRFNGKSVYAPRLCEELQLLPGYKEVTNGYKELAMKATPRL